MGHVADLPKQKIGIDIAKNFAPTYEIAANKKVIIPETSIAAFKTSNMHSLPLGYYKLANPRLIHDDILVEFTVDLGSMEGLDPKTQLYVGLHGTITTP